MAIDFPAILDRSPLLQHWRWDERDAILYALSMGFGADPLI